MNKRFLVVLSCALLGGTCIFAQPKPKNAPRTLTKGSQFFMAPKWTPDGKKVTFTSDKFNGIWMIRDNGEDLKQLSAEPGVGYGYSWNQDGSYLAVRATKYVNNRKQSAITIIDPDTKTTKCIYPYSQQIKGVPLWKENGKAIQIKENNKISRTRSGIPAGNNRQTDIGSETFSVYETILYHANDCDKLIKGFENFTGRILYNPQLSPDNSKVVFQVSGKGLFLCDTDGSNLKHIGSGENPSWMPDSKYIIVSKTTDDGHIIKSGKLQVVDTDTGQYYPFYESTSIIASRPSVCPDGSKVAFNDPEKGIIYILDIKQ